MLISVDQLKEHYPSLVGAGENTLVTTLIGRADALMAAACLFPRPQGGGARTLEQATYELYPDPPSEDQPRRLRLLLYPLITPSAVYSDPYWAYGADTLIASSEYVVDQDAGEIWLKPTSGASFSTDPRAIKVVTTAGFASAPPDLVALCAMTVRHLLDNRSAPDVASFSGGGTSATREVAEAVLPPTVLDALGTYKLWGRASG